MINFAKYIGSVIVLSLIVNVVSAEENKTYLGKIYGAPTQKVKKNIENHADDIRDDKDRKWKFIERRIDEAVDNLFYPTYTNVDPYLNDKYSVSGEYKEIGQGLSDWWKDEDKLEEDIKNRIFGSDFGERYDNKLEFLDQEFRDLAKQHIRKIDEYASENIDMKLNPNIFDPVYRNLQNNIFIRELKIANVVVVMLGAKFAGKIASAVAAKATAKLATKSAGKVAIKSATKAGAAAAGLGSGATLGAGICVGTIVGAPAAPICAAAGGLIGSVAAWFGTDYIVVKGDEYFTRDKVKAKITSSIDEQRNILKRDLKSKYKDKWVELSKVVVDSFTTEPLIEKQRRERADSVL